MDSMINRYTADKKVRNDDAYTPDGAGGKRPDRCSLVYSQRCKEAYSDVPVVLGGIEASFRRIAHFDYWQGSVRRSILLDASADILLYGNAERAIVELSHRLARGEPVKDIRNIRGTALLRNDTPDGWWEIDSTRIDRPGRIEQIVSPYVNTQEQAECSSKQVEVVDNENVLRFVPDAKRNRDKTVIRLPSFEKVRNDAVLYAHANRVLHLETNPGNARALVQAHGGRDLWINPPAQPLTTDEMDYVFGMPFTRVPHTSYGDARIPAYEMIRFSVNIMRGCFGGCSFCSITEHEGRVIQNRSEESILKEIEDIRDKVEGFTGHISDLGGPTANMYRLACKDDEIQKVCRRPSCVYPDICKNLGTNHDPLIHLYQKAREIEGVKKIHIASGLRYDLAVKSPAYVKELVTHHVGGYLKIAPEHTEDGPLSKMMKPGIGTYDRFKQMFDQAAKQAGKEYYLIPYFIAAHPGTTDEDMMNLAIWLKRNKLRADQVQTFLPSPMCLASAMYYSERNPIKPIHREGSEVVHTAKGLKQRRLHKAFLRYHDAENWPLLREALIKMGREDLIGPSKKHLVPAWQPKGTGGRSGAHKGAKTFYTQQAGEGRRPSKPTKPTGGRGKPSPKRPSKKR